MKRYCKLLNSLDSLNEVTAPCSIILKSSKCLQIGGGIFLAWCSNVQQYSNQQYSTGSTAESKRQTNRNGEKPFSPLSLIWSLSEISSRGSWHDALCTLHWHFPLQQHTQKKVLCGFWLVNANRVTEEERLV